MHAIHRHSQGQFQFVRILVFLLSVCILGGCVKEKETAMPAGTSMEGLWGPTLTTSVQGRILDESEQPLAGVTIRAGSLSTQTDNHGVFRLDGISARRDLAFVKAEKAGYFTGSRTFVPSENTSVVEIVLMRKTITGTISATSGGVVRHTSGSMVSFEPDSIQLNGSPYQGAVQVAMANIDPSVEGYHLLMPGDLLAVQSGTGRVGLKSFGMVAVDLSDPSGNKLQIAPGKKAGLTFSIPASLRNSAPDSIELWSFDEENGFWRQEGKAGRMGNVYQARVGHFSFWNCDAPFPIVRITARVRWNGYLLPYARVHINSEVGSRFGQTEQNGSFTGFVPLKYNLSGVVFPSAFSLETIGKPAFNFSSFGPFTTDNTTVDLELDSLELKRIQVRLVDCQGNPVRQGYVLVGELVVFTNQNGEGSFLVSNGVVGITLVPISGNPVIIGNAVTINTSQGSQSIVLPVCSNGDIPDAQDLDGYIYSTVQIGSQIWFRENLRVSRYRNGQPIPHNIPATEWASTNEGASCTYNLNPEAGLVYGRLYNGYAIVDPRGLCPVGWRVPNQADWDLLMLHLGGDSVAGGRMKRVNDGVAGVAPTEFPDDWNLPNLGATNQSGFTALPSGMRFKSGVFSHAGLYSNWAIRPPDNAQNMPYRDASHSSTASKQSYDTHKQRGFSVRCIKEE